MKYFTVVACTSFLAACGGGGGGGSSATVTPPMNSAVSLNSSNQTVALQDSLATAFLPMQGSQSLTGAQTTDESVLYSIARNQLDKLPTYLADATSNSTLTGVVQSLTEQCSYGGSMTVSVNDADNNNVLSAGDSLTIVANNCVLSSGTVTGSLGFVINTLSNYQSSSATNYSLDVTMFYGNFTVTNSSLTASLNGNLSLAITASGVNSLSETISTPSLTLSGTYGGLTRTRSLTNYSATGTRAPNVTYTYLTSYSINGTFTSTGLSSQSVSYTTSTPFVTRYRDHYPSSGVMVITGASNTKISITALSNTQVKVELDANGDGTYESNSTMNWNTLN